MIIENGAFKITDKLKQWLELKEWDQRKLADELKFDESLISQWLSEDKPKKPSWQALRKLCLLTGLDVSELITFDRNLKQAE